MLTNVAVGQPTFFAHLDTLAVALDTITPPRRAVATMPVGVP